MRTATGSHSHFAEEAIAQVLKQAEALADEWTGEK